MKTARGKVFHLARLKRDWLWKGKRLLFCIKLNAVSKRNYIMLIFLYFGN